MAIDFRSDLLAGMAPSVRAALIEALDDAPEFELRGDVHQRRLEERAATLLGKEDALLFPTCTMANEAALMVHCRPGDAVIVEGGSHIVTSEAGAPGALAGAVMRSVRGVSGLPDVDAVRDLLNASTSMMAPRPAVLALENTHLRSGGQPLPLAGCQELAQLSTAADVVVHLDGARLFNAAVALQRTLAELSSVADTVAISLNKGLGAPFGAILAGTAGVIRESLRIRQQLGGGFRPSGFLSAAACAALECFDHFQGDHDRAKALAIGLSKLAGLTVAPDETATNIVFVGIPSEITAARAITELATSGVKVLPFEGNRLRLVTHQGISDDNVVHALAAFQRVANAW